MMNGTPPSFSPGRKWSISLNVLVAALAVGALVVMVNYLAARHFKRLPLAARAQTPFSELTRRVLAGVTNEVKITIYFDKDEPLYDAVWSLLKEYKFANPKLLVETVDYERDPAAALLVKTKYKLAAPAAKDLVIFDGNGKVKIVDQKQLSELDVSGLTSGRSREVRRTHFRGELEFTSALLSVTSPRSLKACFLEGHGEHRPDSEDKLTGYARFAAVLQENNIQFERLRLQGTNDVPADCQLLIIAGPKDAFLPDELEKLDRYLKQGGRLFVLFNYETVNKLTGLEKLLSHWGVAVGNNVVYDRENSLTGQDLVVANFGDHALVKPFFESRLYLVLPRSVGRAPGALSGADAPLVEPLALTGPGGRVITDIRPGPAIYPHPNDHVGVVPLMVAVEKGGLRGVSADRGATRIVVAGESLFLGNETILKVANRDFASHAVNWLLARHELLVGLAPTPIKEYKLTMTRGQMAAVRWIFLAGMPGSVLLVGFVVWVRRRN
jgi:hypothetical protein